MANLLCESSSATHSSGSGRLCQAIGKSVKHGGGIELMTSIWSRAGLAIVLAALTQVGAAAIKPAERPHRPSAPPAKPEVRLAQAAPQRAAPKAAHAPAWLRDRIDSLGKSFNGRVGIAVRSWHARQLRTQTAVLAYLDLVLESFRAVSGNGREYFERNADLLEARRAVSRAQAKAGGAA